MDWYGIVILFVITGVVFGLFMIMIVKLKIKAKSGFSGGIKTV